MDSISPVLVNDKDGDQMISYGDFLGAKITTDQAEPFVHLIVRQGGEKVAEGWSGYFDRALNPRAPFGLYSPRWTGGAADGRLELCVYGKKGFRVLASTDFPIAV